MHSSSLLPNLNKIPGYNIQFALHFEYVKIHIGRLISIFEPFKCNGIALKISWWFSITVVNYHLFSYLCQTQYRLRCEEGKASRSGHCFHSKPGQEYPRACAAAMWSYVKLIVSPKRVFMLIPLLSTKYISTR